MTLQVEDLIEFQKCVVADLKMLQEKQKKLAVIVFIVSAVQTVSMALLLAHLLVHK